MLGHTTLPCRAAEDLEVGSEGLPLLQGVGQVGPQGLRQEQRSHAPQAAEPAHYNQRQDSADYALKRN